MQMTKKVKSFACSSFDEKSLKDVEDKVNEFTRTHDVIDIKIDIAAKISLPVILYSIIYEEQKEVGGHNNVD